MSAIVQPREFQHQFIKTQNKAKVQTAEHTLVMGFCQLQAFPGVLTP
jgi:hypothetical protein